ncbi:hypothetical protein [Larkinella sp.]|uniref:hypothetical protein n=1 Tax=Larkinella sp. TaxID=2034517 RepID=UPI003BAA394E
MRARIILGLIWLGSFSQTWAQTVSADTIPPVEKTADLLADLDDSTSQQALLPHKMIVTQRIFWGPKGLLRTTNLAPLTPEGREKELKIRRTMLVSHQVMGFVTLAGFVAQGLVGAKLYNATGDQYGRLLNVHSTLAAGINLTYVTTALLSLTAPPKMIGDRRGFSSIKLHKYLAVVHMAGMLATNILASSIENHPELKPYHRAAAYTTFGAFALSVVAIKF